MKDKRHIKSFNEHQENLNSELSKETSSSISDVRSIEKRYKLIEEDPQFRKPGGGLFSPPIGTIATWNWKHDLYLFGNGEIGNPVSYVDRKQIENNPKWVDVSGSEIIKEEFNPMDGIDNFLNNPTMIALATAWLLMGKYKVDNLKSWKNDFLDYCNLMGYTIDKEVLDFKFNQLIDKVKKIIKL